MSVVGAIEQNCRSYDKAPTQTERSQTIIRQILPAKTLSDDILIPPRLLPLPHHIKYQTAPPDRQAPSRPTSPTGASATCTSGVPVDRRHVLPCSRAGAR